MTHTFPVDTVIETLFTAMGEHGGAILEAPTGAGKSTRVPLRLLDTHWAKSGRILMLEPRRVAARSVATFMASQLHEKPGKTIGYRTRTDTRVSEETRLEVVTEGVLTRMLLADPELNGISLVIFDEFHERSLQGDLGLALISETREAFRGDLGLLVMSATLDCGPLTERLGLPLVKSEGRSFPVEVRYAPAGGHQDWQQQVTGQILSIESEAKVVLVFLPGQSAIRELSRLLSRSALESDVTELHGGLSLDRQQQVINRAAGGESLVILSTNVAETSLTIENVTHVIDSGFQREPVYDPVRHRTRLVTRRISEASARQRAGRAGRLGPGVCIRCWSEDEVMARHNTPEICRVGLDQLVLDLARWGCLDPAQMQWLDHPPEAAWCSAVGRLTQQGALDQSGAITAHGEAIASMGVEPSLAMLVLEGKKSGLAKTAARIAALLSERDILAGHGADIRSRLQLLDQKPERFNALLQEASRLVPGAGKHCEDWSEGLAALLVKAMPMQLARRRSNEGRRYQMADGPGVILPQGDALEGQEWLVILDTDGKPKDALVRLALPVPADRIPSLLTTLTTAKEWVGWDAVRHRVIGRRQVLLGKIELHSLPLQTLNTEQVAIALLDGVRQEGLASLPWTPRLKQWQARVARLADLEDGWPDVRDETLRATLETWLLPYLSGMRTMTDLKSVALDNALTALLDYDQQRHLDQLLPEMVSIPTGRKVALDYTGERVVLAVKLQELFGMRSLPELAGGRVYITAHLLTPAGRPAAITDDLTRFWTENYQAVRKDLRGRYPKHPWPEDPLNAEATAWTKKRAGL